MQTKLYELLKKSQNLVSEGSDSQEDDANMSTLDSPLDYISKKGKIIEDLLRKVNHYENILANLISEFKVVKQECNKETARSSIFKLKLTW